MAKSKAAVEAKSTGIESESDLTRYYDNVKGGMIVTTVHKGSGHVNTLYVPGNFIHPVVDEDGNDTEETCFCNGVEHLQYESAKEDAAYKVQQKASKKK